MTALWVVCRPLTAIILAASLLATSCSRYEPLGLNGAGSMRVEVEVYKGPLTVPITGQVGQLVAVLGDMIHAMSDWRDEAETLSHKETPNPFCDRPKPSDQPGCQELKAAISNSDDIIKAACYIIDTPTLRKTVGPGVYIPAKTCQIPRNYPNYLADYRLKLELDITRCDAGSIQQTLHCQGEIIALAFDNLATMMRAAAFRTADSNVRRVPNDRAVRGLLSGFSFIASEYGNQLQARITVLQKQFAAYNSSAQPGDLDNARKLLPVGDYLRDAGRTDFINLYDWMNSTEPHGLFDPTKGKLDTQDRIRMAQRLTADYYWQKVNEVYTSGQGDVSMAFIKDDLGNWDLKSFSNDPSALLASYRKATDAVLKTTVRLAAKAASGGASSLADAASAAQLANQLATGAVPGTAATLGGLDVAALHARTAARLSADKSRFVARGKQADEDIAAATAAKTKADSDLAGLETAAASAAAQLAAGTITADQAAAANAARDGAKARDDDAANAIATAKARQIDLVKEAVDVARRSLDDHLAVVSALQDGIAGPPPAGTTKQVPGPSGIPQLPSALKLPAQ